jgi:hypothetical protein
MAEKEIRVDSQNSEQPEQSVFQNHGFVNKYAFPAFGNTVRTRGARRPGSSAP